MEGKRWLHFFITILLCWNLTSCCNSISEGTPAGAGLGAIAGASSMVLLNAPKAFVALGALGGAGLGYYLTSLRWDASGIYSACGQVFTLGQSITIVVPTDNLFETNSADLAPNTRPILDSIVTVLYRYPNNNVLVSGNMSGFGSRRFEQKLSEARARTIATYLWSHGINNFSPESNCMRKLIYVGYGNHFPVANDIQPTCMRVNSRIQITAYPTSLQLHLDACHHVFTNIGDLKDCQRISTGFRPTTPGEACDGELLSENCSSPGFKETGHFSVYSERTGSRTPGCGANFNRVEGNPPPSSLPCPCR